MHPTYCQGQPFTAFKNHIKLEKLHGVKFIGSHEDESACKNLIFRISEYLFEEVAKKKLHLVIGVSCDESTQTASQNKMLYVCPEIFKPTVKFLKLVAPSNNQNAPGLKKAIFAIFN